jgi:hypothetical protein
VRVERGVSQVLFGMLPDQTVDINGSVWIVKEWIDPQPLDVDEESVRRALMEEVAAWSDAGKDGGLLDRLRAGERIEMVEVNINKGVVVEPFPRQWRCRRCGRIHRTKGDACTCGGALAQMHFVAFHNCGHMREPWLQSCPVHRQVAIRLPGTAAAKDMVFFCPECGRTLSTGFPYQLCECGEPMDVNPHRSAAVFSPKFAVVVNAPPSSSPDSLLRMGVEVGGARALDWVMRGMEGSPAAHGGRTAAELSAMLRASGFSEETVREMVREAAVRGELQSTTADAFFGLPDETLERARQEALSLASAVSGGRLTIGDLQARGSPAARALYEDEYQERMREAGLSDVQLLTSFPITTVAFGYTRGETDPGAARLVHFRGRKSRVRVYGLRSDTEALLFLLDPVKVLNYLRRQGYELPEVSGVREARLALLREAVVPHAWQSDGQPLGSELLRLVHSYAHRVVRRLAGYAGVERDSLGEYLLPDLLAFVVYANSRSDFVLGGLQAVFETSLHEVLDDVVNGEARCPLDPGCASGGGACMACLHLGEPSCRLYNRHLSRQILFGPQGFLRG